jgi:hypothetical protein
MKGVRSEFLLNSVETIEYYLDRISSLLIDVESSNIEPGPSVHTGSHRVARHPYASLITAIVAFINNQ